MKFLSPFDHRPDPELGAALRELLTPTDHGAFVEGVMGLVRDGAGRNASGADWWQILYDWARPGLVAAAVLATVAIVGLARQAEGPEQVALEDTLSDTPGTEVRTSFLVSPNPPDMNVILVSGVSRPLNGR